MAVKETQPRAARSKKEETPKRTRTQKKATSSERQLRIKLVRSVISHPRKHREVVKGLGLRKTNSEVTRKDCPEIRGMINKVSHLLKVEVLEQK